MPTVTLRFKLPEEQSEYDLARLGPQMHSVLSEFDQWLRSEIKYANRNELGPIRDHLWELLRDEGIDLNE